MLLLIGQFQDSLELYYNGFGNQNGLNHMTSMFASFYFIFLCVNSDLGICLFLLVDLYLVKVFALFLLLC